MITRAAFTPGETVALACVRSTPSALPRLGLQRLFATCSGWETINITHRRSTLCGYATDDRVVGPWLGDAPLEDEPEKASEEFRELCAVQLELLTSLLQRSPGAASKINSSVFARRPESFETGALQLQRVAAWGPDAACTVASLSGPSAASVSTELPTAFKGHTGHDNASGLLTLGEPGNADVEQAVEEWLLRQPTLTLPGSGGLVLPLAYGRFLVGILIVEREEPSQTSRMPAGSANGLFVSSHISADNAAGSAASSDTAGSWGDRREAASGADGSRSWGQSRGDRSFTGEQMRWIDRVAHGLAMACALDQRAALERAGNQADRLRVRGLVEEVRKPLSALRTLGAMLLPRLQEGRPDRDMASGILVQGDRLREVVGQLQEAVHPGAAAALPEAFRRAVAAQQAASRFPLDAQSPLQLRDVRPPALRSLPDPDIALATARWPLPSSADSGDAACHQDNGGETATSSDDGTGSTSRAGVYIWHDAQAKRKRRPVSGSSESGSSTQPAAWLRGIQQNTQQKPTSEPEHAAPMDAPREQVDDELLPVGRN